MAKKKGPLASPFVPAEEQPYPIPENWCWARLKVLVEASKEKTNDFSNGDTKYVGLEHIEKDGGIIGYSSATEVKSLKAIFHVGQILYGKLRPYLNKHDIAGFEGVCSTDILVFDTKNCADSRYVNYFFNQRYFIEYAVSNSKGINLPRVSESIILEAICPLPPLTEQRRIVDRIESLFAKLDEAKEKAQAVVDGFELRKSAILHKAFMGELTEQWRKEHSASPNTLLLDIEKFSRNWQKKDQQLLKDAQSSSQVVTLDNGHTWIRCTIGAIGRVANGSTPSRKFPQYWDGTIPWVSSGEVRNNIIENTNECITQEGYDSSSVKLLPVGTVLIAMIGEGKTRGQSAILAINAAINQNIAAVVVDHGLVSSRYIWYWFQMNYARNREKGSGTGPQALNCQRVRELDFFVPSLSEQKEVVRILDMTLSRELQAKKAAEVALSQIDTMKKAILARAFRGELGTNDPAEEWAGEMVKKIL